MRNHWVSVAGWFWYDAETDLVLGEAKGELLRQLSYGRLNYRDHWWRVRSAFALSQSWGGGAAIERQRGGER